MGTHQFQDSQIVDCHDVSQHTLVLLGSTLSVAQPAARANPPDWDQFAQMARYIVHYSDWVGVSTISSRDPIMDYPFANVKTVSDGSTATVARGIPYFYLSPMDLSSMDFWKNPKASLSFTLADQYCKEQDWIAQDPRCPRLLMTELLRGLMKRKRKSMPRMLSLPGTQSWKAGPLIMAGSLPSLFLRAFFFWTSLVELLTLILMCFMGPRLQKRSWLGLCFQTDGQHCYF